MGDLSYEMRDSVALSLLYSNNPTAYSNNPTAHLNKSTANLNNPTAHLNKPTTYSKNPKCSVEKVNCLNIIHVTRGVWMKNSRRKLVLLQAFKTMEQARKKWAAEKQGVAWGNYELG